MWMCDMTFWLQDDVTFSLESDGQTFLPSCCACDSPKKKKKGPDAESRDL